MFYTIRRVKYLFLEVLAFMLMTGMTAVGCVVLVFGLNIAGSPGPSIGSAMVVTGLVGSTWIFQDVWNERIRLKVNYETEGDEGV